MENPIESKTSSTATCADCGVEVREGSDFCYNCGHAVTIQTNEPALRSASDLETRPTENGFRTDARALFEEELDWPCTAATTS